MAEANPLAEKISKKLLECSICIETFLDPRALPCHHGFCRDCLEQLVHSSRNKHILVCPTCRKTHKLPKNGVKDLPVHFHLSSLQDTVANEMTVNMPSSDTCCSNCDSEKATVRCLDCKEYLCETCYAPHKLLKAMKSHTIVTIADILSGKVNVKAQEDKFCKVHGKMLEYYCKNERKAVCQDCVILKDCKAEHDRLSLDKAAMMKSSELEGMQKKCNITLKNYQEAVKIIDGVKSNLEKNSQLAKQSLETVRKDCYKQVNKMVKKHKTDIDRIKMERLKELDKQQTTLESTMRQIQKAKKDITRVTESGSKYELISTHAALSTQLQKLAQSQPIAVEKSLGYVEFKAAIPVIPSIGQLLVGSWNMTDRFNTSDFNVLYGLAIDHYGDIALTSLDKGVKVYSRHGEVQCTLFDSPGAEDIAVTPDWKYVTAPANQCCIKIHNRHGRELSTTPITDANNEPSNVNSVAIDTEGKILVGQVNNTISIHHPDGSLISKFATQSMPYRLATTFNDEIISSLLDSTFNRNMSVQLMDYSGGNVRVIQPPPNVKVWSPSCVCCRQGEIFVENSWTGDPTGVYRYTSEGEYLDCITTNVSFPGGIALSENGMELFVAEYEGMVKIFQRPKFAGCYTVSRFAYPIINTLLV